MPNPQRPHFDAGVESRSPGQRGPHACCRRRTLSLAHELLLPTRGCEARSATAMPIVFAKGEHEPEDHLEIEFPIIIFQSTRFRYSFHVSRDLASRARYAVSRRAAIERSYKKSIRGPASRRRGRVKALRNQLQFLSRKSRARKWGHARPCSRTNAIGGGWRSLLVHHHRRPRQGDAVVERAFRAAAMAACNLPEIPQKFSWCRRERSSIQIVLSFNKNHRGQS